MSENRKPKYLWRNVRAELHLWHLCNYATKIDLKNATSVDASKFAKKVNLASLKLEIDKLETTPADLSKLSDVV